MFAWVHPESPDPYYTFWMAPCTLIFSNVHSFTAGIEWGLGLVISGVDREHVGLPQSAQSRDCAVAIGLYFMLSSFHVQRTFIPSVHAHAGHTPKTACEPSYFESASPRRYPRSLK